MAMSTTSFAPSYAISVWADSKNVFIEVPGKGASPLVMKFDNSTVGLAKALEFANARFKAEQPKGGYYPMPVIQATGKASPGVKRSAPAAVSATSEQKDAARDVLRKLGMIK